MRRKAEDLTARLIGLFLGCVVVLAVVALVAYFTGTTIPVWLGIWCLAGMLLSAAGAFLARPLVQWGADPKLLYGVLALATPGWPIALAGRWAYAHLARRYPALAQMAII